MKSNDKKLWITADYDGLSLGFLYYAYLKAKKRHLSPTLFTLKEIKEEDIKEGIRNIVKEKFEKRLSENELEILKSMSIYLP